MESPNGVNKNDKLKMIKNDLNSHSLKPPFSCRTVQKETLWYPDEIQFYAASSSLMCLFASYFNSKMVQKIRGSLEAA